MPPPLPASPLQVIMEFNDVNGAMKARNAMHGRKFAGRVVNATYLTEAAYFGGRYDELAA